MIDHFEKLARALDVGEVTKPAHPTRPQRMNANSFCIRNRVFAMRVGEELVLKLPPKRVTELIEAGLANPNVVGGRPMKEWASLPVRPRRDGLAWRASRWSTSAANPEHRLIRARVTGSTVTSDG